MTDTPSYHAEPHTDVTYLTAEATPTVVRVAEGVAPHEMTGIFDETFSALVPGLDDFDVTAAGPAFSLHHRLPGATMTFDLGFPVTEVLNGELEAGGITFYASTLPAGRIATISHLGGYDGLPQAWEAFMTRVAADGHHTRLPFWEVYVTEPGPDVDPSTLRTDLVTLLDD
ncbi:GyrI-like domain-containing protein [Janibacter alittae]|uniref:GyrI-like domain-containing protein n=1 Tax=Janibacter alittae TaxID=3115209 RepID=A0ABZ2MHK4_9MICO